MSHLRICSQRVHDADVMLRWRSGCGRQPLHQIALQSRLWQHQAAIQLTDHRCRCRFVDLNCSKTDI